MESFTIWVGAAEQSFIYQSLLSSTTVVKST
jgi:hypothetical protein